MNFSDIIIQGDHHDYLQQAVDRQSLPHALLFWGPEGTGKLATAVTLTQYLLCHDKSDAGACGSCRSCVKTEKLVHPDVHFVFPTVGAKMKSTDFYPQWREALADNMYLSLQDWMEIISADNKQGNINASDCQRILEQLMLKSFEADHKILIMWMAEYLRKEGNKLLKMIEEPPADTLIILIAEDRDAILPTVLSRCQQLFFAPIAANAIADRAEKTLGVDAERAQWIAAASQGNWNQALQLARGTYYNPVEWVQDWIKAAWSRDPGRMAAWVNGIAGNSREEHKQILRYILNIWQKLFWLKWGVTFEAEPKEMQLVTFLNTKIEFNELETLVQVCEENLMAIERNANPRLVWMQSTLLLRNALIKEHAPLGAEQ